SPAPIPPAGTTGRLATSERVRPGAAEAPGPERPGSVAGSCDYIDLAYEEFFLRRQAGEKIDVQAFCNEFPGRRSSLRRILEADEALVRCPSALQPGALTPEPAAWPRPGETIGDFTLRRELGHGAFSRVYLATEASAGDRPVAIKLTRAAGEAR